jgi:hypothetical protein
VRNPLVLGLALAVYTGTLQAQPRLVSSYVTRDASGRMVRVDQWDDRPAVPAMLPLPAVPQPPARIVSDPLPPTGTAPYQNQQSTQTTNVFLGSQPAAVAPAFTPSRAYVPAAEPVREVHYVPSAPVRDVYYAAPAKVYVPVRAPAYAPVKTKTYAPAAAYPAAAPVQYVPVPVEAPRRGGLFPGVYRFFFG